jgi:hypothetical protein
LDFRAFWLEQVLNIIAFSGIYSKYYSLSIRNGKQLVIAQQSQSMSRLYCDNLLEAQVFVVFKNQTNVCSVQ